MNLNVPFMLLRNVHEKPDKLAIVSGDRRYTYREFNERVNRLANALLKMGVQKGDKVAYLLNNCGEFAEISFALSKIGALSVPLNFRLKGEEIGYILEHSDSSFLFFGPEFKEIVAGLIPRLPLIKKTVQVGGSEEYENMLQSSYGEEPPVRVLEEDEHSIMYTSGTTMCLQSPLPCSTSPPGIPCSSPRSLSGRPWSFSRVFPCPNSFS
jgi:acyl-CoA synthetase (AMP-forming)/AMP-acid ligase II